MTPPSILTSLAILLALGAAVPYIIDTIKGRTRPNLVTWATWTLIFLFDSAMSAILAYRRLRFIPSKPGVQI